ncbi:MAG: hypothetical protein PHD72_00285 [Patescibacteria group bacterium]|nr:hypothetical protein [Patescibacteria group bacterium]
MSEIGRCLEIVLKDEAASFAARALRGDEVAQGIIKNLHRQKDVIIFVCAIGHTVRATILSADAILDESAFTWFPKTVIDNTAAALIVENKGRGEIMPGLWA